MKTAQQAPARRSAVWAAVSLGFAVPSILFFLGLVFPAGDLDWGYLFLGRIVAVGSACIAAICGIVSLIRREEHRGHRGGGIVGILLSAALTYAGSPAPDTKLARNTFLLPYVEELKRSTSPAYLETIRGMARSDLIQLHIGYGTGIRNKWVHGVEDPEVDPIL